MRRESFVFLSKAQNVVNGLEEIDRSNPRWRKASIQAEKFTRMAAQFSKKFNAPLGRRISSAGSLRMKKGPELHRLLRQEMLVDKLLDDVMLIEMRKWEQHISTLEPIS